MSSSSKCIFPLTRHESMVSFNLFKHLRKVDLPQPEGPIKAKTSDLPTSILISFKAWLSP